MISIRHAKDRGKANFGWLDSKHSFSFGSYYDEAHMGFSALRVINVDSVTPGAGFATHGHKDMEIISYGLVGNIAHRDSEGNVATLPPGEFQLMSAGTGIRHSEFNPSDKDPLHFLQIWIQTNVYGEVPGYQQKDFGTNKGLTLVVSTDGEAGSLTVKQDAKLYQLLLDANTQKTLAASTTRNYYVHVIEGELSIADEELGPGDGAKLQNVSELVFSAQNAFVKALVFDLP
jgi:redox-sensitive bicupin YhaK (pirin superfamily)